MDHASEWPGAHCVRNLLNGEPIEGTWFARTKEYSAQNRSKMISPRQFATPETVTLSPLPCWQHLSPEQIHERVGAIVRRIEETAAKSREESGSGGPWCRRCLRAGSVRPAGQAEEVPRAAFRCVHPPGPS